MVVIAYRQLFSNLMNGHGFSKHKRNDPCSAMKVAIPSAITYYLLLIFLIPLPLVAQKAKPLNQAINSPFDELAPVFSVGGDTLFFVRNQHPQNIGNQDIWYSIRVSDGAFGQAKHLGTPLNNASPNAVCGISTDGKRLYLNNVYRAKGMTPGLSVSYFDTKTGWLLPRKVSIPGLHVVAESMDFQVIGDSLVLISMPVSPTGGYEDLFISRKNDLGDWIEPENLGNRINTDSSEFAPFLAADGKTLYFTSTGHGGFGDADIFRSVRLDDTWANWSKPENVGKNVNTADFEAYFAIDEAHQTAYFARAENEFGDLWEIKVSDIADTTQKDVTVLASLTEIKKEAPAIQANTELILPKKETTEDWVAVIDGLPMVFSFAYNSSVVEEFDHEKIERLINFLKSYPDKNIKLVGRTDAVGEDVTNQMLSEQRALMVQQQLIKAGIAKKRVVISAEGAKYAQAAATDPDERRRHDRQVVVVFK